MKPTFVNAIALGLLAAVTVGIVAMTDALTSPAIELQRATLERKTLTEVLEGVVYDDVDFDHVELDARTEESLRKSDTPRSYLATLSGAPVARILSVVTPPAYAGPIELLVGVDVSGRITGVRVLAHRETPGLGDKIERRKSDWIATFTHRSLDDPPDAGWATRRDGGAFDALTAATITSRAVIRGVHDALALAASKANALRPVAAPEKQ